MSILIDKNARVLCQGLGKAGTFHATQCREYGTQVVGGVAPGKGGTTREGFALFNPSVKGDYYASPPCSRRPSPIARRARAYAAVAV